MAEATQDGPGDTITIRPADPYTALHWPDPTGTRDARWRVWHAPDTVTVADMRALARAAETYDFMFQIPQRQLLPTHAAIRAHLADRHRTAGDDQ